MTNPEEFAKGQRADDYIIINYHRPVLDQPGGGHISPLGAYDQESDSFLILDVNPNGKTWVWVRTDKPALSVLQLRLGGWCQTSLTPNLLDGRVLWSALDGRNSRCHIAIS